MHYLKYENFSKNKSMTNINGIIEPLDERSEFQRREELFNTYLQSEDVAKKYLERVQLLDAAERKLEARTMLWQLFAREDNPAEGCIFFIETLGWTFDPRKNPKHIPFVLFEYQKRAIRELVDAIDNGHDLLIEKSRDMGVTWIVVYVFLWYWLFRDGVNLLMGSYKEKLVDDRTDDSLFGRLDYALQSMPKWVLPKGFNAKKHRNKLKLENPANRNLISGDTMNPDFGRGSRKTAIFFDELGSWDYAKDGWESCGDVTACRIANSTPKGRNFYWKLRNSGIPVLTLHWSEHPLKDKHWYEFEKTRRSSEEVAQELDIDYSKSQEGRVYPEWNEANVSWGLHEYDDTKPLYVGWDYGRNDGTAIIWAQPEGRGLKIIDSYYKTGETIDFFVPFITGIVPSDSYRYSKKDYEIIQKHRGWKKGTHFGDPSGRNSSGVTHQTVFSILESYGIYTNWEQSWNVFQNRKLAAKALIRDGVLLNQTEGNEYFNMCMEQASYPQVTREGEKEVRSKDPNHDWTSHHRSAFEYLAQGLAKYQNKKTVIRDKFKPKDTGFFKRRRALSY
jgi:hypothetical protein